MEIYYAIGDIHGQSNLLNHALSYIKSKNGKDVIFLGDYIDRGPDSVGVLEILMKPKHGMNFICIKGNHEDMLLEEIEYSSGNFEDILFYCKIFKNQLNGYIPLNMVEWLQNLKHFHIIDNNIFAHAYYDVRLQENEQNLHTVMWYRFMVGEDFVGDGKFLTHGHTPYSNGPESMPSRINLDCDGKSGKQLCVGIYKRNVTGPIGYTMVYSDGSIKENIWG